MSQNPKKTQVEIHRTLCRLPIYGEKYLGFADTYGEASVSRIDKIIGLFCKRALQKTRYSAEETYNYIDPTDRSHPIALFCGYIGLFCEVICTLARWPLSPVAHDDMI